MPKERWMEWYRRSLYLRDAVKKRKEPFHLGKNEGVGPDLMAGVENGSGETN